MKMSQSKKRHGKQITFVHAFQIIDDEKIFRSGVVFEEKGNLFGIKRTNKKEKLRQLASCHVKLLKDGYLENGVEGIYNSTFNTTLLKWMFKILQTP
jgi:hypothetical protein